MVGFPKMRPNTTFQRFPALAAIAFYTRGKKGNLIPPMLRG
jgi:hypothetical protein